MVERGVQIPVRPAGVIHGDLLLPDDARGLVVFAHGSGSSRGSPRNRQVADALRRRGLATLLFDLLTDAEEADDHRTGHNRFDIRLLAERLQHAVGFIGDDPDTAHLPVGLFGASTGAAGALVGAADQPERIGAVVSRGGRPDLAGTRSRRCAHRRCSSSAGGTRWCSTSTGRPPRSCVASTSSSWCPARRTCSKSRARSTRSRASRATGSRPTSGRGPRDEDTRGCAGMRIRDERAGFHARGTGPAAARRG